MVSFPGTNLSTKPLVVYILGIYIAECEFLVCPSTSHASHTPPTDTLAMRACVIWDMNKTVVASLLSYYIATFIYVNVSYFSSLIHCGVGDSSIA